MLYGLNEDLALPLMAPRRLVREGKFSIPSVEGSTVLITGAGGSIGSELVRQVASAKPKELLLIDHSEENLYEIMKTLTDSEVSFPYSGFLADIRDRVSLMTIAEEYLNRPVDLVLHAAALKHVPLLETEFNLMEALRTNVLGTRNILHLASRKYPHAGFVMISTDKAVEPTSVMGMTKRVAELLVSSLCKRSMPHAIVRFGNVIGSSGSVIPLFRRQIAHGGPVTITDFRMDRFFMTIQQACQLVLKAAGNTKVTTTPVYVLEMGDPVNIKELAERLIRQVGMEPGFDIELVETGIRPGEKLHESLSYPDEKLVPLEDMSEGVIQMPDKARLRMGLMLEHLENRNLTEAMKLISDMVDVSKIDLPEGM